MEHGSLVQAIRHTVLDGPVPAKAIAIDLGIPYSTLLSYCIEDGDGVRSLPARLIVPLVKRTGDPAILDFLAAACDRVAVLITTDDTIALDVLNFAARTMRDTGALLIELGADLQDQQITPVEAQRIHGAAWRAVRNLANLIHATEHVGEKDA